jgi:hypothetical protein
MLDTELLPKPSIEVGQSPITARHCRGRQKTAYLQERPMRTHRFGRKIKLPATIAIKHQIRMRMAQYEVKKAEAEARAQVLRGQTDDNPSMSSSSVTTPYGLYPVPKTPT